MILSCFRCKNDKGRGAQYQNEQYGYGMRVHNRTQSRQGGKFLYRCTVCGQERTSAATGTPSQFRCNPAPLGKNNSSK
jgi:hypothetical protein